MRSFSTSHVPTWTNPYSFLIDLMKGAGVFIAILMLTGTPLLYGQNCSDCGSRPIWIYDLKISSPRVPVADHDSILNFYNAIKIAPSIAQFLTTTDPSRDCMSVSAPGFSSAMDVKSTLANPSNLAYLAQHGTNYPEGSAPDYWIGGTVTALLTGKWDYHFYLHTATDEVVVSASGTLDFYPAGDTYLSVTKTMFAQTSPLYEKIRDFEIRKRDSGPPYAIKPSLECTVAKRSLDFGETTNLHFELKDCDGAPLKQRDVTIDYCSFGKLDKMAFTTDDNGEADLKYTAPQTPETPGGIADIQISFSYTEPWAKPEDKEVREGHVAIEVKAPPDSWYMQAYYSFSETRNWRESRSDGYSAWGQSSADQANNLWAWIKAMNLPKPPIPNPKYSFVADPTPVAIKFSGHNSTRGMDRSFWSNPVGYIKTEGWSNSSARMDPAAIPKYNISINDKNHSFGFTKLTASQAGKSHSTYESYDPINGTQTSSSETPASPTTSLNWNSNGFVVDTSYSYHTIMSGTESREYTTQKCTSNDTLFALEVNKDFVSETTVDTTIGTAWLKSYSKWMQHFSIIIMMDYHRQPTTAIRGESPPLPKKYELSQNYPNPFNPSTTITYSLPKTTYVSLKIINALGQEVAMLVNEQKSPGQYQAAWNANVPSGIYFYRLQAGEYVETRKMVLLR